MRVLRVLNPMCEGVSKKQGLWLSQKILRDKLDRGPESEAVIYSLVSYVWPFGESGDVTSNNHTTNPSNALPPRMKSRAVQISHELAGYPRRSLPKGDGRFDSNFPEFHLFLPRASPDNFGNHMRGRECDYNVSSGEHRRWRRKLVHVCRLSDAFRCPVRSYSGKFPKCNWVGCHLRSLIG